MALFTELGHFWPEMAQKWPKNGHFWGFLGVPKIDFRVIFMVLVKISTPQILGFWGILAILAKTGKKWYFMVFFKAVFLIHVHFSDYFYFYFSVFYGFFKWGKFTTFCPFLSIFVHF